MAVILAVSLVVSGLTADDPDPDWVLPTPYEYLYATYPDLARKLDCIIMHESTWDPYAKNGGHLGLAQFDYQTWLETPQGQAGQSRYDPYAAIDALAWGWVNLGSRRWTTARLC
jgi:hypothetical protein